MKLMNKVGPGDPKLKEQFEKLEQTRAHIPDSINSTFQVGPFAIRLASASSALHGKISKAFNHLRQTDSHSLANLTICLWDTSESKENLPPLDWKLIHQNGYQGYSKPPFYFHYFDAIQALSVLNMEQNKAHFIVQDTQKLPWWVSGSPLQVILHIWFRNHGMHLTHTAAISNGQTGLLLTGKGGSGKSTTVLACLTQGLFYVGEDYCLLAGGDPPTAYSIYQSAKWRPYTRELYPGYDAWIANPKSADSEKALIYYQEIFPSQIKCSSSIHAIISLHVGQQKKPVLKQHSLIHSLKDLMMSTLLQLPFPHPSTMTILQKFASQTEHFHLTLGQDLDANAALLKGLMK